MLQFYAEDCQIDVKMYAFKLWATWRQGWCMEDGKWESIDEKRENHPAWNKKALEHFHNQIEELCLFQFYFEHPLLHFPSEFIQIELTTGTNR